MVEFSSLLFWLLRRFGHRAALLGIMVASTPSLALRAAVARQAEIETKPVQVEHRTFNRSQPPRDMPALKENEAALCFYQFGCQVECGAESSQTLFKVKPARISKIKLILSLKITLWLPENGAEKLRAHEEGHREICETLYHRAPEVARKWGNKVIGVTLQHSVKDEAAAQAEIKKVQQDLMAAYMHETSDSCDRAQKYFDSITAHGTNTLAERTAVDKALAQETNAFQVNIHE